MALDLPPVPPAGVTRAQISSALDAAAGVTLASPEAAVHLGNATTIEAVRQVVTAIRSGLLTVDAAVSAITGTTLPALADAISDKADVATVSGLTQSLQTITEQLPDFARVGQIPTTPGEVGADPAGAAAAVQSLLTAGYATTTSVSDGLAGKVNVGTYNGRQTAIDTALSARPTVTEADARYATASALATAISDRLTQAAADARYATPTAVTAALAGKLDLSSLAIDPADPNVLTVTLLTSVAGPDPTTDDPDVPVVTPPTSGGAIDALMPHPYYTPRNYSITTAGVTTSTADPYQPFDVDRPPSASGVPTGYLAAPSLYGYPDETNTGVPAGTTLTAVTGEIKLARGGVTINGTFTARPTGGAGPITVGPITLYSLDGGLTATIPNSGGWSLPFHNVIDGIATDNLLWQQGNTNTLIKRSLLNGNGRSFGAFHNNSAGLAASFGNGSGDGAGAGFAYIVDSRLVGGAGAAQGTVRGGRYYLLRCNISGGADQLEPSSNAHGDFLYLHGNRRVETYHNDAIQIASSVPEPALAAHFGGWSNRFRRITGLSYGEKVAGQWLQFGDITNDVANVLVQDCLAFGGQYMFGFGFGKYRDGFGAAADGTPITKLSPLTGQQETHLWVKNIFIDGIRLGRKAADGFPGGGNSGITKVPGYGITAKKDSTPELSGAYGDPPPVSRRAVTWDDTSTTAWPDFGRADWETAVAPAEGLDFTHYTPGA